MSFFNIKNVADLQVLSATEFSFNTFLAKLKFNSFSWKLGLKHYHGVEKLLFIWNCWAEITPQWTKIVISPVRNITLKIWHLFFELMKIETKLQQKLFDKRTLTWKNESHAKNEQNRIKAILRIFDFVNNPIQFEFFLWFCVILVLVQTFWL